MNSYQVKILTIIIMVGIISLFVFSSTVFAGELTIAPDHLSYRELVTPYKYADIIREAAQKYNIDPNLLGTIIRYESGFNSYAVSSAGAKGLMQVMGFNFRSLGIRDPFDPRQNIMGGTKYFNYLLEMWHGNLQLALASYNAGPGHVRSWVARAGGSTDWQVVKHFAFGGTRNYIDKKVIPSWTLSFPKVVAAPEVTFPTDGDIYHGGDIIVEWNQVEGAMGYIISVRDLTSNSQIINNKFIGYEKDYVIPDSLLTKGHEYRIAIAAVSREGELQWKEINLMENPQELLFYYIFNRLSNKLEEF